MVSVTSDIASNTSLQNARARSRDDQASGADSFGSLIDSNAAPALQPDLPTVSRPDDRPAGNDTARPILARNDAASPPPRDRAPRATDAGRDPLPAKNDVKDATRGAAKDATKAGGKTDGKADDKAGSPKKVDADKATDDATTADADAGSKEKPLAVAALAIAIPVPPVATGVSAAAPTPETAGATAPLAIAAAVLKAQAAATEAAGIATDTSPAATTESSQETFAALIASATPGSGKKADAAAVGADAKAGKTDGKTDSKTAGKTDGKTDGKSADAAQTAAPAAPPPPKGGSTDGSTDSGTGKPDSGKPDPAAAAMEGQSHEHRTEHAAAAATTDPASTNGNTIQQPLLPQPAAAVPTAQLTATVANNMPVPLNGVAVEIAQSAKAGKSTFEIRLDPAELGRIDVRLEVDKHGNVTSHLTVEKPETLTMLRQDAPQLQRALEQAGFKTNDSGLQFSLRDQSSGQQQQNNGDNTGRRAQRLMIHEDESVAALPAGRGYSRMLGSSSGVDISI